MSFYQGYTMRDVMKEYAIRFFSLLDEAYKLGADQQLKDIAAVKLGLADQKASQGHIDRLQRVSEGEMPGDHSDDYSALDALKARL